MNLAEILSISRLKLFILLAHDNYLLSVLHYWSHKYVCTFFSRLLKHNDSTPFALLSLSFQIKLVVISKYPSRRLSRFFFPFATSLKTERSVVSLRWNSQGPCRTYLAGLFNLNFHAKTSSTALSSFVKLTWKESLWRLRKDTPRGST